MLTPIQIIRSPRIDGRAQSAWIASEQRAGAEAQGKEPMSTSKNTAKKYSPEVRERAVRMVLEHQDQYESQWAAMASIAEKIGCTAESLRKWVRQAERDQGRKPGLTTDERERLKALERENKELRRANEILRKASAFFAQAELDRREK